MEHDIVVNQSIQHLFFCTKACHFVKMNIIMVKNKIKMYIMIELLKNTDTS